MQIGYSKEKLSGLLIEGKEKALSIGIIIFTLVIAVSIYRNQARQLGSLNINRDTEIKKNEVLNEIKQAEKSITFYKNLLNENDMSSITNVISNIAKDSNVRIISIMPGTQEQQPLYIKYPFTVIINTDSYHSVGKFISSIESYSDVYSVNTVSIKSAKESQEGKMPQSTDKLIINLTINVIAFKG